MEYKRCVYWPNFGRNEFSAVFSTKHFVAGFIESRVSMWPLFLQLACLKSVSVKLPKSLNQEGESLMARSFHMYDGYRAWQ